MMQTITRAIDRFVDRLPGWVGWALIIIGLLLQAFLARAAEIPREARAHQRDLVREARIVWGMDAPIARLAGQIHQESGWRADARSKYADGLAQFTPGTAAWISTAYPDLGLPAPFNVRWAIRALVTYDQHLLSRIKPWYARDVPPCDRWAMALAAYNGGPGWITRDRRLAAAAGADPDRWWNHTELHTRRAEWAWRENRDYPRKILLRWEPLYLRAGWPGLAVCEEAG